MISHEQTKERITELMSSMELLKQDLDYVKEVKMRTQEQWEMFEVRRWIEDSLCDFPYDWTEVER